MGAARSAAQQNEAKDFVLERATRESNFGRTILGLNLHLVQLVLVSVLLCILNRGLVLPHNGHVDDLLDDALLQTLLVGCWRTEFQNCRSSGTLFSDMDLDCRVLCHGDDFCVLGDVEAIKTSRRCCPRRMCTSCQHFCDLNRVMVGQFLPLRLHSTTQSQTPRCSRVSHHNHSKHRRQSCRTAPRERSIAQPGSECRDGNESAWDCIRTGWKTRNNLDQRTWVLKSQRVSRLPRGIVR